MEQLKSAESEQQSAAEVGNKPAGEENMGEIIKTRKLCRDKILSEIDFSMNQGEMVAVMGPSGSGKSTFLYQLSGMDRPDSGKILFDGEDISRYSEDRSADMRLRKMGFVFQQMNMLPDLTIIDNIILPAIQNQKKNKTNRKSEKRLMQEAAALMQKLGIEGLENRKINEVSGGQLQRACICRALMNQPLLLLADEPTGALNKSSSEEILKELVSLNQEGISTLIVTHDSKVASYCDRVVFILDGAMTGELELGKYNEQDKQKREMRLGEWLERQGW